MELAVYALIVEGAQSGEWAFADPVKGQQVIDAFQIYENQRFRGVSVQ